MKFVWMGLAGALIGTPLHADIPGCETPERSIRISDDACFIYADKIMMGFELGEPGEHQQLFIRPRTEKSTLEAQCRSIRKGTRIKREDAQLECLYKGWAILTDREWTPGTEAYYLFDSTTGQLVATLPGNDKAVAIENNQFIFYDSIETLPDEKCPQGFSVGYGCRRTQKTAYDLLSKTKSRLKGEAFVVVQ